MLAASQGAIPVSQSGPHGPGRSDTPTPSATTNVPIAPSPGSNGGNAGIGQDWAAALELTIATKGAEPYKSRLQDLFRQMITPQQMDLRGWMAVRALPYLDANAKDEMREAVKAYLAGLDKQLDATPFGVPPSLGTWGGSGAVVDMAIRMYFLHKTFPDVVGFQDIHFVPSITFLARTRSPALLMSPVSERSPRLKHTATTARTMLTSRRCDSGLRDHQAGFSRVHR